MEINDQDLIDDYIDGNINALEPVIDKYKRPLYSFILKMTEGNDDADEIFQEVWFKAIKNIKKFKGGNLISWLFRITHNLIIDRARKKWRTISLNQKINNSESLSYEDQVSSNDISIIDEIDAKSIGKKIEQSLDELSLEQKEVFILRMYEKISFKEISKIQNCSINTCLARMQYAISKLKEILKDDFNEYMG
tara:strand:- start:1355 stop:1933 length:579 start_codon:yes stop_codon:yes gene_type:complete